MVLLHIVRTSAGIAVISRSCMWIVLSAINMLITIVASAIASSNQHIKMMLRYGLQIFAADPPMILSKNTSCALLTQKPKLVCARQLLLASHATLMVGS